MSEKVLKVEKITAEDIIIFGESLPQILYTLNEEIAELKNRLRDHTLEISRLKDQISRLQRECLYK